MKFNALIMDPGDNVVTCIEAIKKNDLVSVQIGKECRQFIAVEPIQIWNKMAIKRIAKGGYVCKYGEIIGSAIRDIEEGAAVSHLNIRSLPRNYDDEINA